MVNKRGWLRIVESVAGIMIVAGILLAMYSRTVERPESSDYLLKVEQKFLSDVSLNDNLRKAVLLGNVSSLEDFALDTLPKGFLYSLRICELGEACAMEDIGGIEESQGKDVFVQERIIGSLIDSSGESFYNPKKVRIFMWSSN